jgi:hypothetical protein
MGIPESQLETWSHQGSVSQSSATYNTIKNVLSAAGTPYSGKNYSVFLQGSYGNDTNIYAESDVDIVMKLNDCWQSDLSSLSEEQKNAYKNAYPNATYTHVDFKRDVLRVLTDQYGGDVKVGDKAILIAASGNRRQADVIAAIQFRRYHKFKSTNDQSYDEGICLFNAAGEMIPNYPHQHATNLTRKHQETNKWLKPMARVVKNLRAKLVDDALLGPSIAPSYYLEGLLYNVPSERFTTSLGDCFVSAMNWIQKDADRDELVCANEQYYLLRDNTHTCWPRAHCDAFLNAAIGCWNEW